MIHGEVPSDPAAPVARNLRTARLAQGLSLDELARRSGVSKSMLRQIEVGRSSPTIGVLWKIANGLKLPFSALLAARQSDAAVADFTSQGPIRAGRKGYRLFPLVLFKPDRPLEMYYAELDGGVAFEGEPHQGGARETVVVIEGALEIALRDTTSAAHAGQLVQFDAAAAHRYINPGTRTARLIMTIDYAI
jgi:XRE family transcriptional regulator, regulator of sulfur utilization